MAITNGDDSTSGPVLRGDSHHHADKYGTKFVNKTEKYQQKAEHARPGGSTQNKGPAGGFDATPVPKAAAGYTMRITFHRAENLPFADVPTFSADPYIIAVLETDLPKRHKQDTDLRIRTPTIHRDTNPKWNSTWTIAHVPASGFHLKCRIYDEDPADHDDRLGNVHVDVNHIDQNWSGFKERKFEVKKRMGSKRAYTLRGCAALLSRRIDMKGSLYISVENLGKSEGDGGRAYTVGPLPWSQHFSPLIGMIAGTKIMSEGSCGRRATERYNFAAIQMQLQGPVPEHLYHRYVEFRPFVAGMFTSHTLRGRILNHALHHQHARIYNYDGSTKYGEFEKPNVEMTKKFLDLVHYDQGGRIFTYVITLDGQLRFTETGKEFGIDLLSKHTMHSDVSIYIAFSGEFFIRRLKQPHKDRSASPDPGTAVMPPAPHEEADEKEKEKAKEEEKNIDHEQHTEHPPQAQQHHETLVPPTDHHKAAHGSRPQLSSEPSKRWSFNEWARRSHSFSSSTRSPASHAEQTQNSEEPSKDPSHYELIIDNDSGTYRPNAKYLGQLKKFLQANLPGIRIATLDCQKDEEKMSRLKKEQRERKKKSGKQVMYMQNPSMSSISSSEEEELERRVEEDSDMANDTGVVKSQWKKVKQLAKGSKDESGSGPDEPGEASGSKEKGGMKRESASTGDKASFDTATEHGDGHFVTPKPSLGDGGLSAFNEKDQPLSGDIEKELGTRHLDKPSQDDQKRSKQESTNTQPSETTGLGSIHQAVTSST